MTLACFVPVAVFGVCARFMAIPDVLCKSPDELSELMPGLRLHALPILNIHDGIRNNFIQSMFFSTHGLGDVSFYYLSSSVLSLLGLPMSERFLYAAGGVTNLAMALAGGILGARLLGSAGSGWIFAMLTLASPYFVFISKSGWARLTWTPLLLLLLFLSQWKAMRDRGAIWTAVFVLLGGFISLTDGLVMLPIMLVSAVLIAEGRLADRLKQLTRDRVFLCALAAVAIGFGLELLIGLEARRRGTSLTLIGYVLYKGGQASLLPSFDVLAAWTRCVDFYFPFRGAWLLVTCACLLAAWEGIRGRMIGFIAAWWLLASLGLTRYMTQRTDIGWLNAYQLVVPSYLLVAWLIASIAEGRLPFARHIPAAVRGALAMALLLPLTALMLLQANTVAFASEPAHGVTIGQLVGGTPAQLRKCHAVKAAAFYVRAHATGRPYVFHVSSDVPLGYIGEFYYGLSRAGSRRPEEANHLFDFGLNQFHRKYPPSAFYRAYGVEHFDYYVDVIDEADPLKTETLIQLSEQGARVVCTIRDGDRPIGRVFSFHDEPPIDLDYHTAAAEWERTFAHPRTLFLDRLTGTSYFFGDNWKAPEERPSPPR